MNQPNIVSSLRFRLNVTPVDLIGALTRSSRTGVNPSSPTAVAGRPNGWWAATSRSGWPARRGEWYWLLNDRGPPRRRGQQTTSKHFPKVFLTLDFISRDADEIADFIGEMGDSAVLKPLQGSGPQRARCQAASHRTSTDDRGDRTLNGTTSPKSGWPKGTTATPPLPLMNGELAAARSATPPSTWSTGAPTHAPTCTPRIS